MTIPGERIPHDTWVFAGYENFHDGCDDGEISSVDAYGVSVCILSIGWLYAHLREVRERPLTVSKYHRSTSWLGNWKCLSCKSVSTDNRTGSLITSSLTNTEPSSMGMSVSCLDIVKAFVCHPCYSLDVCSCKGFVKFLIDKASRINIISLDLLA